MSRRITMAAAAFACVFGAGAAAPLWAASCCGGASNTDQFGLSKWRGAMVGVSPQISHAFAVRDGGGAEVGGAWRSDAVRLVVGGAYRVAPDWQVAAAVPGLYNAISAGALASAGGGLGDAGLQVRYELLDEDTCFMRPVTEMAWDEVKPSVHLFLRGALPTGRPTSRATDGLGASITGRGLWTADAGVDVTKVWGRFGNSIGLSAGAQTPDRSGVDGVRAFRWEASAGLLVFPKYQRSLGLFVSHRQERAAELRVESTQVGLTATLADLGLWWFRASVSAAGYVGGRNTPVSADGFVTVARFLP
jgi:hypothetical protein